MAEWESLGAAYDYSKVVVHCADGDLSPTDPTQCGDNLTWSFDESTGTLIITGSGEMWNWGFDEAPWYGLKNEIRALLLPEGLTRIGQLAFEMLLFCQGYRPTKSFLKPILTVLGFSPGTQLHMNFSFACGQEP